MNKLLGQRKQFNLNVSSSSSDDESSAPIVLNRFNISLAVGENGALVIQSTDSEAQVISTDNAESTDGFNTSLDIPKVHKQRTNSQRSNKSTRSTPSSTTRITRSSSIVDDTSDDEAFMNNSANFTKSPRPLRRSLRKKKTSSLKRRQAMVQRVPEDNNTEVTPQRRQSKRLSVSPLDTTQDLDGDLSIEWTENDFYTTTDAQSSESGCQVISEKSFIIANAETEDALSEFSDCNPQAVFKMPFPVSYRPNLSKRKLVVESDEEYISKTFQRPIKRTCIRYYM